MRRSACPPRSFGLVALDRFDIEQEAHFIVNEVSTRVPPWRASRRTDPEIRSVQGDASARGHTTRARIVSAFFDVQHDLACYPANHQRPDHACTGAAVGDDALALEGGLRAFLQREVAGAAQMPISKSDSGGEAGNRHDRGDRRGRERVRVHAEDLSTHVAELTLHAQEPEVAHVEGEARTTRIDRQRSRGSDRAVARLQHANESSMVRRRCKVAWAAARAARRAVRAPDGGAKRFERRAKARAHGADGVVPTEEGTRTRITRLSFPSRSTPLTKISSGRLAAASNVTAWDRCHPGRTRVTHVSPVRVRTIHRQIPSFPAGSMRRLSPPVTVSVRAATVGLRGGMLSSHGVAGTSAGSAYAPRPSCEAMLSRFSRKTFMLKWMLPVAPGSSLVRRTCSRISPGIHRRVESPRPTRLVKFPGHR